MLSTVLFSRLFQQALVLSTFNTCVAHCRLNLCPFCCSAVQVAAGRVSSPQSELKASPNKQQQQQGRASEKQRHKASSNSPPPVEQGQGLHWDPEDGPEAEQYSPVTQQQQRMLQPSSNRRTPAFASTPGYSNGTGAAVGGGRAARSGYHTFSGTSASPAAAVAGVRGTVEQRSQQRPQRHLRGEGYDSHDETDLHQVQVVVDATGAYDTAHEAAAPEDPLWSQHDHQLRRQQQQLQQQAYRGHTVQGQAAGSSRQSVPAEVRGSAGLRHGPGQHSMRSSSGVAVGPMSAAAAAALAAQQQQQRARFAASAPGGRAPARLAAQQEWGGDEGVDNGEVLPQHQRPVSSRQRGMSLQQAGWRGEYAVPRGPQQLEGFHDEDEYY